MQNTAARLQATYFDGKTAKAHAVELHMADGVLHIQGADVTVTAAQREVQWPERTLHGKRMAQLTAGGLVQCADGDAWDAWCRANGQAESSVVVMQQNWRWVAACAVAFVLLMAGIYQWGLPTLARGLVALIPQTVDTRLGISTLQTVDAQLMQPSELPTAQQAAIRAAFSKVLESQAAGQVPLWNLEFRKSELGANALALPGGTIILTDDMVVLVESDTRVLAAVLAHELGHVQHRHGLRMLVQTSALGAMAGLVLGDFSTMLAALPALMGQAHYSREAEREADAHAKEVLTAANIPPAVMVTLFDKLKAKRDKDDADSREKASKAQDKDPEASAAEAKAKQGLGTAASWLGIAFASHPADEDRVAFFRGTGE